MKYTPRQVLSQDRPAEMIIPAHPDGTPPTSKGFVYPPEVNPGMDRVFPAPKKREWKDAPEYDKSFKKVKQLREIKMTDYSVGTSEESWHLVSVNRFETAASYANWLPMCLVKGEHRIPIGHIASPVVHASTRYKDNYDLIRAQESFPSVEYTDTASSEEINDTLNDLKSTVVQDSYSGFDALTELAEFPETLGMLLSLFKTALRPLQGIRELREKYERARRRGKTHSEAHGEVASQWMQYRYGIMPLIYSIQDAIKLLDEAFAEFKTDRAFSVFQSKPKHKPVPTETHIAIYRAHEVRINTVAKAKFASQSLRLKDLITTNIFVTAWELIPMSFVIDWFINVGDFIASHTSGIAELAEERKFCYSIRRTEIDKHVLRYKFTNGVKHHWDYSSRPNPCTGGPGEVMIRDFDNLSLSIGEGVLYQRKLQSYERKLFTPDSVELKFGPDLNWMRMLDGYVLSFNQISKVLKKLR